MDEDLRWRLRGLILMFGEELCLDRPRCRNMLRNMMGQYSRACALLMAALEQDITLELLSRRGARPEEFMPPLVSRLLEKARLSAEEARWAVENWALALGLVTLNECTVKTVPPEPAVAEVPAAAPRRARTLYVGGLGADSYETIAEAVEASAPGGRIIIRPGHYSESILLDQPLEVLGDGPPAEIVIQSTDTPALHIRSDGVVVRGLSLRAREQYSVEIVQASPTIENCDITSGWFASVAIHGAGSNPTIRKCRVHHGQHRGFIIFDSARGLLEDCDIYAHVHPGVVIERGGDPVLRRCRIYDGITNGVLVGGGGKGTLEECEIDANGQAGVEIVDGGDPILRNCQIHSGQRRGVFIRQYGRGRLEDCDIYGNGWAGVALEEDSDPVLERCRIHHGRESGITIYNSAGLLEDCEISANNGPGATLGRQSKTAFIHCRFLDGHAEGLLFLDATGGLLEECVVRGNVGVGVEIRGGSDPQISRCEIRDGLGPGVVFHTESRGVLTDSQIDDNAGLDVLIGADCTPVFHNCRVGKLERQEAADAGNPEPNSPGDPAHDPADTSHQAVRATAVTSPVSVVS